MLNDDDLRLDIGRCEGGAFLRLVHVPTEISPSRGLSAVPNAICWSRRGARD